MLTIAPETRALKEWAVAAQALSAGRQIVTLRKGGIREAAKAFRVEHEEFLLYPTYDHQRADLLQEHHRPYLATLPPSDPTAPVELSAWAKVVRVFEVDDAARVAALAPHYLWTVDYALERLRWRPRQPLQVLAIRVYRLPEPVRVEVRPEYLGCRSWVTLASPIPLGELRPVLNDADFERELTTVAAILGGPV